MSGVDTVRGIGFQHAQAILAVLDGLDSPEFGAIRVEGVDDVVDIEVFRRDGTVQLAMQAKTRTERTWGKAEILQVLRRWAQLPAATHAEFEFVTDGRLGPTGEQLASALQAARAGSMGDLATLLGEDPAGAVCAALSHAHVHQDPSGIESLLGRAERQLLSMLPAGRSRLDLPQLAEQGVDRLFRRLSERAGSSDPGARRLTREELAGIAGVPADQSVSTRWPGALRTRYLQAARMPDTAGIVPTLLTGGESAPPVLVRRDAASGPPIPVSQLLDGARAAVVGGRSGTGKTTAAASLRREAALADRVVLVAHAEAYLPGRLAALAADALAEVLQEDVATASGRQALADADVVMVIDGVSEVPQDFRRALGEDLRATLTSGQGARVVLLGRDIPALNAVVPTSRPPSVYLVAKFEQDRRRDLAARIASEHGLQDPAMQNPIARVEMLLARAHDALGEAVDNPMLLSMALNTLCAGLEVNSRSEVLQAAVDHLARRGGVTEADTLTAALGIVYCELLDSERRYADSIEWSILLRKAATALEQLGVACAADRLDHDARQCGLVSPLGWSRTIVPVHDAFADYLAGYAHARGLVPLPRTFRRSDEARVLFAAEIGGVEQQLALAAARDAPFLTVELAQYDNRRPGRDAPEGVEQLLALLIGPSAGRVGLWDCGAGTVVALNGQAVTPGWIGRAAVREAMLLTPAAVVEDASPLRIAVRLWRLSLVQRLVPRSRREGRAPRDIDEVRSALADHVGRVGREVRALVAEIAPRGHADALLAGMPPLGIRAFVQPIERQPFGGPAWPVVYEPSDAVDTTLRGEPSVHTGTWSSTTFDHLTRSDARTEAISRVRNALERLTTQNWLAL